MSTRSLVGVMIGDICRAVYVHSDGYLDGVGQEVLEYKTQAEVEELISHGDRSYLDGGFYKDRGETGVDPSEYKNFEDFFDAVDGSWAEYYYVFNNGVWYFGETSKDSKYYKNLNVVEDALQIENGEIGDDSCARNARMDGFMGHIHNSDKFTLEASHSALLAAKEKNAT